MMHGIMLIAAVQRLKLRWNKFDPVQSILLFLLENINDKSKIGFDTFVVGEWVQRILNKFT